MFYTNFLQLLFHEEHLINSKAIGQNIWKLKEQIKPILYF